MAEAGVIVPRATRIRIWSALLLPPVAWYANEQGLSLVLSGACHAVVWVGPALGAAALCLCAVAVWLARAAPPKTYRWLAQIARLGAGLFSLAIAFQLIATLIVPPCVR